VNSDDEFRLRCMRMALDSIMVSADNGERDRLSYEAGRLFVLEQIRQMRVAFEHYEKRAT
jgi:hypothetical protein